MKRIILLLIILNTIIFYVTANDLPIINLNVDDYKKEMFLCFSTDGHYAISRNLKDQFLFSFWDIYKGKLLKKDVGNNELIALTSISISDDGKYIAFSSYKNGSIIIYETTNFTKILQKDDITFKISKEKLLNLSNTASISVFIKFSPDSKYILVNNKNYHLILIEIETGNIINTFYESTAIFNFTKTGKYLYYSTLTNPAITKIFTYDNKQVKLFKQVKGNSNNLYSSIVISNDCENLVQSSLTGDIELFDFNTKKIKYELKKSNLSIYEKNKFYNSMYSNKDFDILKEELKYETCISIEYSNNNKKILASSGNLLYLFDIDSGKKLQTFYGYKNLISFVHFTPDEKYVIAGGFDISLVMWNIETGKEIGRIYGFSDGEFISISPEGYFDASLNGAKYLSVKIGNNTYSMENFYENYFRPNMLLGRLKGETVSEKMASFEKGIMTPPETILQFLSADDKFISVSDKINNAKIDNGYMTVKVCANDTGGGIKGVRLYVNGKTIGEDLRGLKLTKKENYDYEQEFRIALSDGENNIKAVSFSDDLTESKPVYSTMTYTSPLKTKPSMFILAVGINEYKNKKYNLNYCVPDVKGFVETLKPKSQNLFENVNISLLLDAEATKSNFIQNIENIKLNIKPEDVFVFFYAGHGIALPNSEGRNEFFYILNEVTQMTDYEKCNNLGIAGSEFKKILAEIKSQKQVLFVDACNSGAFADEFAIRGAAEEDALAKLSRATGSVIIAATTKDQFAQEVKELGHGVFTYVLLDGLNGKASNDKGQLTAGSIKLFIDDNIPDATLKYKQEEQYPTTFMFGQDFPIGLR